MTGRKLTIGEIFRQGSEAWALMVFQRLCLDFETQDLLKKAAKKCLTHQGRNQDLNLAKQKYQILNGHKNPS